MEALVFVNPEDPGYRDAVAFLFPYLDHLGVPFRACATASPPGNPGDWPLIIAGHRGLGGGPALRRAVVAAVQAGTGLVTFDPGWPFARRGAKVCAVGAVAVAGGRHWITARHRSGDRYPALAPLELRPPAGGAVLARFGGVPLVAVRRLGKGRIVGWASWHWASPAVLGPFAGLDDLVWRGFAWAARKPFALRGLPPLVAMRVDDVAGRGGLWGASPLYWVGESIRAGFRPWLGSFIYNLSPATLRQLRPWLERGLATEFPHAFGRRPVGANRSFHYAPDAAPMHGGGPDDFIYYDHYRGRPWPDAECDRRLAATESWCASRGLPRRGGVFIPHWYEAGPRVFPRLSDRWKVEMTSVVKAPEARCEWRSPWLEGGPFRASGEPGPSIPRRGNPACIGHRPVYYAGDAVFGGRRFFNAVTEIRDLAGYEWAPGPDAGPAVDRGVEMITRAIDSMGLAALFTHETDYIWKIPPAVWSRIIHGVAKGISSRRPRFVTLEEGIGIVRATRSSRFSSCALKPDGGKGTVEAVFTGSADRATSFHLFTDCRGGIGTTLVRIPPFRGNVRVRVRRGRPR